MYLKVFVTPGARKESVEVYPAKGEEKGDTLLIAVREPASGNHANRRVCELVALRFGVRPEDVHILTGHRSRGKMVGVSN